MAHVDAPLVKQILDIPQGKREPNIQYHGQRDDLGRRLEIAKRTGFPDVAGLDASTWPAKPFCSDAASAVADDLDFDAVMVKEVEPTTWFVVCMIDRL